MNPDKSTADRDIFYQNLYSFLTQMSNYQDDDVVIEYYYRKFTFGMFREMIRQTIIKLESIPIIQGERVIISLVSTPEAIALVYACNMLGIIPVLTDVRLSVSDFEALAKSTSSKYIFINDFCSQCYKLAKRNPDLELFLLSPTDCLFPFVRFNYMLRMPSSAIASMLPNVYYWRKYSKPKHISHGTTFTNNGLEKIIFTTSGSTGSWKYVELTSCQLNISAWQHIDYKNHPNIKSVLSVMPLFTCYGFVVSVHLPLSYSKKVILHPIYKAQKIPKVIMKYKPNFYAGVFSQFYAFTEARCMKRKDLSFLKLLYFGGDSCEISKLNKVNRFLYSRGAETRLCQGYGMTETASGAFAQDNVDYRSGSVGKALPFTNVKILEEGSFEEQPVNIEGEICINTPCQTKGYFNDRSATNELIYTHPDGKNWIHTGDIGYLDADGNLFVSGRIKNLIVSVSGTKIFPAGIEECLSEFKYLRESAVIALPDRRKTCDKLLILYAVPKMPLGLSFIKRNRVAKYCRNNLPMYLVPDKIIITKSLPKTSSGKTDRKELQKRAKKKNFFISPFYRRKLK